MILGWYYAEQVTSKGAALVLGKSFYYILLRNAKFVVFCILMFLFIFCICLIFLLVSFSLISLFTATSSYEPFFATVMHAGHCFTSSHTA